MKTCSICTHEKRSEIEAALVDGTAYRDISRQFQIGKDALYRHRRDHLPAHLAQAKAAQEEGQADDLLAQVIGLKDRAMQILAEAEAQGELKTALAAIRTALECLELLGQLAGELQAANTTTVNVQSSPEWITLRSQILEALEPFPEARRALAEVLHAA